MKTINVVFLIVGIVAILVALTIIFYKYFNERINIILNKVNKSSEDCYKKLNTKLDLLKKMINHITTNLKIDSKTFNEVNDLKIESLDSFKEEKLLNKCYKEINKILEDNPLKEMKSKRGRKKKDSNESKNNINDLIKKYADNDLKLVALRTYYNVYTLEFNNMIKKFPYNIIAKIKKYSIKTLLEGKELDINFNNDLEV